MEVPGIVHVAGEPIGTRQCCIRCGAVLIDNTNTVTADGRPGRFFGPGPITVYDGSMVRGIEADALPCTLDS